LISETGKVVSKSVSPVPESRSVDDVVGLILNSTAGLFEKESINGWTDKKVKGIGVGCPGIIDFKKGTLVRLANFPNWSNVPLGPILETRTGLSVKVENDANVALLSEIWSGKSRATGKLKNVSMVTLGTGVGSAFIVDGRLLRGANGMAGELGHCILEPHGDRYSESTGVYGILEDYASARSVGVTAAKRLKNYDGETLLKDVLKTNGVIEAKDVFEAAKSGDTLALEVYEETCDYIGISCINLTRMLDPELILLAGGLAASKDLLLTGVRKAYLKRHWTLQEPTCVIELADHLDDAGIIGAAFCEHPEGASFL